jgi:hypothetical protein
VLTGGNPTQARAWPVVANPQEDALDVRGLFFQEAGTDDTELAIWREDGRLYLRDQKSGPYSLEDLGGGGGGLTSDADHGDRGGGSLHSLAVAGGAAGFLSGLDKSRLNSLWSAHGANSYVLWTHNGAGGSAHALAIAGGAAGFLSGTDKSRLDQLWAGTAGIYAPGSHGHDEAVAGGVAGFLSGTDKDRIDKLWSGGAGVYSTFAGSNHSHPIPRVAWSISGQTFSLSTADTVAVNSRGACSLAGASAYRLHVTMSGRAGSVYAWVRITPEGGSAIDLYHAGPIGLTQKVYSTPWVTLPYLVSNEVLVELCARQSSGSGTNSFSHVALEVR